MARSRNGKPFGLKGRKNGKGTLLHKKGKKCYLKQNVDFPCEKEVGNDIGETDREHNVEDNACQPLGLLLSTFSKDCKKVVGRNEPCKNVKFYDFSTLVESKEIDKVTADDRLKFFDSDRCKNECDVNKTDKIVAPCEKEINAIYSEINVGHDNTCKEESNSDCVDDPFISHFCYDLSASVVEALTSHPIRSKISNLCWPNLNNLRIEIPKIEENDNLKRFETNIEEDHREYAKLADEPKLIDEIDWDKLHIKTQIQKNIKKANKNNLGEFTDELTGLQKEVFSIINSYQDLIYTERNPENGEEIRFIYCLHVVNHILKTRSRILHHNEKLKQKGMDYVPDKYRDQSLVRPKVIILVPFKESCLRIVNMISSILIEEDRGNIINKTRFEEEFSGSELFIPRKNSKPEDYENLFKGNIDDKFKIGIGLTKKSLKLCSNDVVDITLSDHFFFSFVNEHYSNINRINILKSETIIEGDILKKPIGFLGVWKRNIGLGVNGHIWSHSPVVELYTDFYSSDIIIASPLGLRLIVGAEGDSNRDFDFLSSVEILILDQTELFLMQNWDHLLLIFEHLHIQPKMSHGTDFSRIRSWVLNGWSKFYRQTLIFSSIITPELNAIFNRRCCNYSGKIRVENPVDCGAISQVITQLSHVFQKFKAELISVACEARFKFFIEKILHQYKDPNLSGILIYVPSYFDYVTIRNYLKREDYNFVQICEYSKDDRIARARDKFFHNEARFLLYSERFHFFRRIKLKGIRHIIFYQLPTFPHFYSELCNFLSITEKETTNYDSYRSVVVLYCKYDMHQLSGVVKTSRAMKLLSSEKDVHMFTTG